eukprot:jgi/Bigna1/141119/aug1.60_g15827
MRHVTAIAYTIMKASVSAISSQQQRQRQLHGAAGSSEADMEIEPSSSSSSMSVAVNKTAATSGGQDMSLKQLIKAFVAPHKSWCNILCSIIQFHGVDETIRKTSKRLLTVISGSEHMRHQLYDAHLYRTELKRLRAYFDGGQEAGGDRSASGPSSPSSSNEALSRCHHISYTRAVLIASSLNRIFVVAKTRVNGWVAHVHNFPASLKFLFEMAVRVSAPAHDTASGQVAKITLELLSLASEAAAAAPHESDPKEMLEEAESKSPGTTTIQTLMTRRSKSDPISGSGGGGAGAAAGGGATTSSTSGAAAVAAAATTLTIKRKRKPKNTSGGEGFPLASPQHTIFKGQRRGVDQAAAAMAIATSSAAASSSPSSSKRKKRKEYKLDIEDFLSASLSSFVQGYLLDHESLSTRKQARSFLYLLRHHATAPQLERLFRYLTEWIPFLPWYGERAREFLELVMIVVVESRKACSISPESISKSLAQLVVCFRNQNESLSNNSIAALYAELAKHIRLERYLLDHSRCRVCWHAAKPLSILKLKNISAETKYTYDKMIVKLASSHVIQQLAVRIDANQRHQGSSATSGQQVLSVKRIRLYFNAESHADLTAVMDKPSAWTLAKEAVLARGQSEVKITCLVPFRASNLMVHFAEFHKSPDGGLEILRCPRCNTTVFNKHGLCPNCRENAYQCRQCRNINYEHREGFLCNECGYCRFAKFYYTLYGKASQSVVDINNEAERKQAMDLILAKQEKLDRNLADLHGHRRLVESTLDYLGREKRGGGASSSGAATGMTSSTSAAVNSASSNSADEKAASSKDTKSSLHLLKNKEQLSSYYGKEVKNTFDEIRQHFSVIMNIRKQLAMFMGRPRVPHKGDRRPVSRCYKCSKNFVKLGVEFFCKMEAMAADDDKKVGDGHTIGKLIVESGGAVELALNAVSFRDTTISRAAVRSLCSLVRQRTGASSFLVPILRNRTFFCIKNYNLLRVEASLSSYISLICELCDATMQREEAASPGKVRDDWDNMMSLIIDVILFSLKYIQNFPALANHAILPCLKIVRTACSLSSWGGSDDSDPSGSGAGAGGNDKLMSSPHHDGRKRTGRKQTLTPQSDSDSSLSSILHAQISSRLSNFRRQTRRPGIISSIASSRSGRRQYLTPSLRRLQPPQHRRGASSIMTPSPAREKPQRGETVTMVLGKSHSYPLPPVDTSGSRLNNVPDLNLPVQQFSLQKERIAQIMRLMNRSSMPAKSLQLWLNSKLSFSRWASSFRNDGDKGGEEKKNPAGLLQLFPSVLTAPRGKEARALNVLRAAMRKRWKRRHGPHQKKNSRREYAFSELNFMLQLLLCPNSEQVRKEAVRLIRLLIQRPMEDASSLSSPLLSRKARHQRGTSSSSSSSRSSVSEESLVVILDHLLELLPSISTLCSASSTQSEHRDKPYDDYFSGGGGDTVASRFASSSSVDYFLLFDSLITSGSDADRHHSRRAYLVVHGILPVLVEQVSRQIDAIVSVENSFITEQYDMTTLRGLTKMLVEFLETPAICRQFRKLHLSQSVLNAFLQVLNPRVIVMIIILMRMMMMMMMMMNTMCQFICDCDSSGDTRKGGGGGE